MTAAKTRTAPRPEEKNDRRLGRANLRVPVQVAAHGYLLAGTARNLSLGGMFVATGRRLPVGDRVVLRIALLEESEPVEIRAEVSWCRETSEDDRRPAGMGLRFTEPLLEAAIFVRVLLRLSQQGGI
jgi:uncharacterized protein (TIGR02266 family)